MGSHMSGSNAVKYRLGERGRREPGDLSGDVYRRVMQQHASIKDEELFGNIHPAAEFFGRAESSLPLLHSGGDAISPPLESVSPSQVHLRFCRSGDSPRHRRVVRDNNNNSDQQRKDSVARKMEEESGNGLMLLGVFLLPYVALVWSVLPEESGPFNFVLVVMMQLIIVIVSVIFILGLIRIYFSKAKILEWTLGFHCEQPVEAQRSVPEAVEPDLTSSGIQTDSWEESACILQKEARLKLLRRQVLKQRRLYRIKIKGLKSHHSEVSAFLARLQLRLPELERENELLAAERDAIAKQHEEERRRNRELIARFQKLHQQFGRLGQGQFHTAREGTYFPGGGAGHAHNQGRPALS